MTLTSMMMMNNAAVFAPEGEGGSAAATPAAATPAAAPASSPSEAASATNASGIEATPAATPDASDFDIPADLDAIVMPESGPVVQPEVGGVATPSAPAPTPVPVTPPAVTPPTAPTPQAPAATPAQPAGAGQPPTAPEPVGLENIVPKLVESRDAMITNWATNLFALSPKEIEGLQMNAETVIPQLMAKVLWHTATMIPHQIQQFVPGLIAREAAFAQQASSNEQKFFTMFPDIPKEQSGFVAGIARTFAQANPGVRGDDAYRAIGEIAMRLLNIQPRAVAAQKPVPVMPPHQPVAATTAPPTVMTPPAGNAEDDAWTGFDLA